jgi:hypothetical protein
MNDKDEVFWVERPADLLELPTPNRSDVAVYNDATKLVIIAAIVLAVLKVRAWIVVLTVGLLVIVVAYYNKHPSSARRRAVEATVEECKEVLREYKISDKERVEPFVRMNGVLNAPREMRMPISGTPTPITNHTNTTPSSSIGSNDTNVSISTAIDEFDEEGWRKTVTLVDDYMPNNNKKRTTTKRTNSVHNTRNEHFQHLEAYYESLEDDREQLQRELDVQDTFEDTFRYH